MDNYLIDLIRNNKVEEFNDIFKDKYGYRLCIYNKDIVYIFEEFKKLINRKEKEINSLEIYFKSLLMIYIKILELKEFSENTFLYGLSLNKTISIQSILYEVIKVDNYYLFEKSFEYCGDKEESILDILIKLFDGFNKHLHQNKKEAFINNIKNKNLKNKIKNYFDVKDFSDKRRKILDIAKSGNLIELQQYIYDNKIELKSFNNEHFDILISAIENKVSIKIVKHIINQCHYHNFDYYINIMDDFLKIYLNDEYQNNSISPINKDYVNKDYMIPIYTSVANNNFDISNLLLYYGADINYTKECNDNIITYLYKNKLLNFENLTYILNNGFEICEEIHDNIIDNFIEPYFDTSKEEDKKYCEHSNSFLEIFLKNIKEYHIQSYHYEYAVNKNNITAVIILLNYDKNKTDALLNYNSFKDNILNQLNNIKSFHECNFYYNINNEDGYIDEKTFLNLKSYINKFYGSFLERREKIINMISTKYYNESNSVRLRFNRNRYTINKSTFDIDINKKDNSNESNILNVNELKKILMDNNITELNSSDFDILIYAIENYASVELIKYIIDQYNQYKTLNYSIKNKNDDSSDKTVTPLIAAINHGNFNIADYLLKKGAKFNYNENYSFLNEIYLTEENIEYIFSNNYSINTANDNNEIIKKILSYSFSYDILETYLNCSLIKEKKIKIDDSIYGINVLKYDHDLKALLLLYEHDYRDKDLVSTIIYNQIYEIEDILYYYYELNNDTAKKLISKLKEIDNIHKKRDDLLSSIKDNKSNFIKSKILFEEFIKNNNINIKEINTYDFDMLIYAIKNNFPTEFIKYIIGIFDYKNFNYTVKDQSPLMVCISFNNFEIADLLLEKGADINYNGEYSMLDTQNVKYLLKKGYKNSYNLINRYIYKNIISIKKELVEIIIQHYFYNKELIKVLLNIYSIKKALTVKDLQKILSVFAKEVFNDDIYDKINDEEILNIFLKYEFDNRKRNKILLKFKIKKNNLDYDYYNYYDYDNYDDYDGFDESGSYCYPDGYEEF
ncbi:ankyrin [Anaeromyces robustus]|uniref:Ankyrin n=1 Tax=Anaeromyces robustus TaxID=1754192 RepID=A0A1Y1VTW9_9FUNG|nr:ankyrin [Anaeromyces robustus]|eukprot:ORX64730.1 ankyrin [Anaeromyces robustus]